jgi:hypothetical protein
MPLPLRAPASVGAGMDVAGAPGWDATGEPVSTALEQPATTAIVTAAAAPNVRVDLRSARAILIG